MQFQHPSAADPELPLNKKTEIALFDATEPQLHRGKHTTVTSSLSICDSSDGV